MSEDDQVLDDYLMRDSISPTEYMLELIAQNIQKDWSFISGITPRIPPFFDGTTSWFKYEELIEDHTTSSKYPFQENSSPFC